MRIKLMFILLLVLNTCAAQVAHSTYYNSYLFPQTAIVNFQPVNDQKLMSIDATSSSCQFYTAVANAFITNQGIGFKITDCEFGGIRSAVKIAKRTKSPKLDVTIRAFAKFSVRTKDLYLLLMNISGNDKCYASCLLLEMSSGTAKIVNPKQYSSNLPLNQFRVMTWSQFSRYYNRDSLTISLLSDYSFLSLENLYNSKIMKREDINLCEEGTYQSLSDTVVASIHMKFLDDSIIRKSVIEPISVSFSPANKRYMHNPNGTAIYKTAEDLLGPFMQAYDADDAKMLYVDPADAPTLTYTESRPRRSYEYYDENCLQFLYRTNLPNRYGLDLSAVVFNIVHNNVVEESAALLVLKTRSGFKIFTSQVSYVGLTEDIQFLLRFNPRAVNRLSDPSLVEYESNTERLAIKYSRRTGEQVFQPDVFMDNLRRGLVPKEVEKYLLKDVRIIGPKEFW